MLSQRQNFSAGFSQLAFNPELVAAVAKSRENTANTIKKIMPVPFVFLGLLGCVIEDIGFPMGFLVGGFFSFAIGAFYLFDSYQEKSDKPWEGVLVDKYKEENTRNLTPKDEDAIPMYEKWITYVLVFRTTDGQKKTLEERKTTKYYDYFRIGDRVLYHPQLNGFYEKYDKSLDRYLICPICGRENKIKNDRCKYCNNILVK